MTKPAKEKGQDASGKRSIVLVDDHPMMRMGLGQIINRQEDLVVCGEANSPSEAFRVIESVLPDLVITDITMPGRSGLDFIKDLRAVHAQLRILVVSMHDEAIYAERALRSGAQGYVMKEAGGDNLLAAIRRVLGGQNYLSDKMTAKIVGELGALPARGGASPIRSLTDREFEVFRLIGEGNGTRAIADQLHLSTKTVDVHKTHLKEKLKLADAAALASYAIRWVQSSGKGE